MNKIIFNIHRDHLIYQIVCATPGLGSLTDLDRLVFSGILLFVGDDGSIVLTRRARKHIMQGLNLSQQGLTNAIRRLVSMKMIGRGEELIPHGVLAQRSSTVKAFYLTPLTMSLAKVPRKISPTGKFSIIFSYAPGNTGTELHV